MKWFGGKDHAKGVAIPYIIALVLGLAVVAVLGYWFFVLSGRLTGAEATTPCDAKQIPYCQAWQQRCYDEDDKPAPIGLGGECGEPNKDRCLELVGAEPAHCF